MPYIVGIAVAALVSLFANFFKFDRDRSFYPTVLIVVGSYYVLFATMAGSGRAVIVEVIVMMLFVAAAVAGMQWSPWFVVAGLAGHGVFDFFHGSIIDNPGVPQFWPPWCLSYDVMAAACVAILVVRRMRPVVSEAMVS